MSTDIDVEEIKTIAEELANREEFILSKQQWRSKLDRERGFREVNDAKERWIEESTKTKEDIKKAKEDFKNGEAKLKVLACKVAALHPDNIKAQTAAKLRFEYIGEVTDATAGLFDMIESGIDATIKEAVRKADEIVSTLRELALVRATGGPSPWIARVNQGYGPAVALKNAMMASLRQEFPNKIGKTMTEGETAIVQARLLQNAGRSTSLRSLVAQLTEGAMLRAIIISLALIIVNVVEAALSGGAIEAVSTAITGVVGAAAGIAAGTAATAFLESTVLASAGPVTTAILGTLGGAIAGMVVGAVVGIILSAIVEMFKSISHTSYTDQWEKYMNTPIVYRVIVHQ